MEFTKWYLAAHRGLWWKKEISSVKNLKEAFWETAFCSVKSSQSYSFSLKKPFAKTVLVLFSRWYLESRRGLWWNRKYLQLKSGNKLSKKLFVFCEFISQSYRFPLKKPFTKIVLVEFSKWYLEAHRRLWWKRKYPKIKTEKKVSEKLLCVLLIHLTELQLSPEEAFR